VSIITIYAFRVRDERTGKWRTTRYKMTLEEAGERYGKGNYQVLELNQGTAGRRPAAG
jgi:hypothetical protein